VTKIKNYTFFEKHECNMCLSKDIYTIGIRLNRSQGKNPRSKNGISVGIDKCNHCGLIFSNPQPVPRSIDDHYGIDPKTYWLEEYFEIDDNCFKSEIEGLKTLMHIEVGMKGLDVGAGIGKAMISLEKAGLDMYGVEPSEPFYNMAIQKMGISKEKLVNKAIEETDFEENTFDFITFGAVLEHFYNPNDAIEKAMKWLKPGGILHVEIPHSKWLIAKIFNLYYRLIGTDYVTHLSPMHAPFHLYEFSLDSFIKNGQIHHYEIAKKQFYVGTIGLPKMIERILTPIMKWTNTELVFVLYLKKK
jgi:ubiquinone/menaquinone biosynthesis C-methylase UbiE